MKRIDGKGEWVGGERIDEKGKSKSRRGVNESQQRLTPVTDCLRFMSASKAPA